MLMGRLDDLGLPEILQLISLARKNGKLVVKDGDREGVVLFRDGRIVFAASEALHETLGSDLAADRLAADAGDAPAPALPGEPGDIEAVIRDQIEKVVRELIGWRSGRFVFEMAAIPEAAGIALDAGGFVLETGLNPDEVLLKTLTKLDERSRRGWERDLRRAAATEEEPARSDISGIFQAILMPGGQPTGGGRRGERTLADLRALSDEMAALKTASPLAPEVVLLVLRYAAQVVNRGVLFEAGEEFFRGIGQFGLPRESGSPNERVRRIRVPRAAPSVLAGVAEDAEPFRGRLASGRWNDYLVGQLGGGAPLEVIVMPVTIEGTVVGLLYGDNLPDAAQVGAVDGLEILLREISLAIEKARLQRRLEALERGRR